MPSSPSSPPASRPTSPPHLPATSAPASSSAVRPLSSAQPVILDTNFWLLPFENRVDVMGALDRLIEAEPFRLLLPTPVLHELKAMAGAAPNLKNTRAAKGALRAIDALREKGKLSDHPIDGPADGAIITAALQAHAWVATNDKALRQRLRDKRIRVIFLRDGPKLDFE